MQSQEYKSQNITFTYDQDFFGTDSKLKTVIDEGNFEREKSPESKNILGYVLFYNNERLHGLLGRITPMEKWNADKHLIKMKKLTV